MRRRTFTPPDGALKPVVRCVAPVCGWMLDAFYQPGLAGMPGYWHLECANPHCPLAGHTFSNTNYPPVKLPLYLESGYARLDAEYAARSGQKDVTA